VVNDQDCLLPTFFIVGPPRTGTSWLHEVLQTHTCLPRVKETRFFDDRFHRGPAWYRTNYPASDLPMGEVGPTYFVSTEARQRIVQLIPNAKVICIFRNPVERLRSHYRLKRAYAMIPWDFEEALARDSELMESSKYATHLKAWQQTFGAENVRAMLYDDLKQEPQLFVDELAEFIGISRISLAPSQISYVHSSEPLTQPRNYYRTRSAGLLADWCKAHRFDHIVEVAKRSPLRSWFLGGGADFTEMSSELVSSLYEQFRPEVEELESMLGRDLGGWKSQEARLLSPV
jgi:Sulfotransferase domain